MEKTVAHYKVFIAKDRETGNGKLGFVAYVPKLGIADDGYTVEEALANVQSLIKFHLNCLIEEGESIPAPDEEGTLVTSATVKLTPAKARKFWSLATT